MNGRKAPAYDLAEIQARIRAGRYWITFAAHRSAGFIGVDDAGMVACVLSIRSEHFYKSMPSKEFPGLWQDVYRPTYRKMLLYVKLQIEVEGEAVVISFKRL